MDEIGKTRLRVAVITAAYCLFIFCVIFGICKIYRNLNPSEPRFAPVKETKIVTVEKKNTSPSVPVEKPEVEKVEKSGPLQFDRSKTFYGIRKSWKKYRLPKCGILADVTDNKILWSYNADKIVPIASMSKMLTLYMAFEAMNASNKISLGNKVKLIQNSAMGREGGFGFKAGDIYSLEDLVKAATIRSCNDAAAAVAIYFGGTEKIFVDKMNAEAAKLGMKNTFFVNPHGLPDKKKDNLSTMNDMLILSMKMIDIPEYMRFCKMKGAKIGSRTIANTNTLMRKRKYPGVDGLKTGYTKRAGFCLAFSCLRNGRRLVGVVAGFPSSADRENFVSDLLDWAYK